MECSQTSPSRNLDHTKNSTTTIIFQILSRLPAKSLIRFKSVSKLWLSIITSKYFKDSFLTQSKTRPRLLFTFKDLDSRKSFFFTISDHQNNEKSSIVIARHDIMTISDPGFNVTSPPVNGFVCCMRGSRIAVFNPTTGFMLTLPHVKANGRDIYARLGYDPVDNQYKVLCVMMLVRCDVHRKYVKQQEHLVFSLTSQFTRWRKIEITGDPYAYLEGGICIDGAIYYGVGHTKIARFDLRYEKMRFIQGPKDYNAISCYSTLTNYKGKLACVSYDSYCESNMRLWILQDAEKQEWSSIMTCVVPCDKEISLCSGESHTNEVVMVSRCLKSSKHFFVYYFDMIKESITRRIEVEIDGMADYEFRRPRILCFPGHIENLMYF